MAHFLAEARGGSASPATRTGTKQSGIRAVANGWDVGVRVVGTVENGREVFRVYRTTGSNGVEGDDKLIATITPEGHSVELRGQMVVAG